MTLYIPLFRINKSTKINLYYNILFFKKTISFEIEES